MTKTKISKLVRMAVKLGYEVDIRPPHRIYRVSVKKQNRQVFYPKWEQLADDI